MRMNCNLVRHEILKLNQKKEVLKQDIREKLEEIDGYQNEITSLQAASECARLELEDLRKEFWDLVPDPDYLRE